MKKKLWIPVIAILLLLGAVYAFVMSQPRQVFDEKTSWEIYRVEVYENGSKKDITGDVEKWALLQESLLLMERSRLRTGFSPVSNDDVCYQISGICDGRTLHILLSEDPKLCVVYEDSIKGGWRIHRAEHILNIVDLLCAM